MDKPSIYPLIFKSAIDRVFSLVLLVVLLPALLVISLILAIVNKGSPLFYQERIGKKETTICIIKFKSMTDERDAEGQLLPDNKRLTKIGAFIRKTSLDELPQLFNVLKGDMSLVGPRPLLPKYLKLYSAEQRRRHSVQPGITGWAQVNGRNSISWTKKFEYDVYYVDHQSFLLDLKIIWLTIAKVLRGDGVNQSADQPMPPFNGKN